LLTDAELRAYLLGQSTEAQAERVETNAVEDDDFFAALGAVEDDLVDDYTRGALTDAELQPFLVRYGRDRHRLLAARALAARTAPSHGASPFRSNYWMVAAAAVVLAAVGLTFGNKSKPRPPAAPAVQADANAERTMPITATVLLTLGTSRSAASPPAEAVLPPSAATLHVRVRLDPADTFAAYGMTLRSDRGAIVWQADAVRASSIAGELIVVGDVPAASLGEATYELTVSGSTAGGRPEVLGVAAMTVRR
jgi:hypothetical protein